MIRILFDQNFNGRIIKGLLLRIPDLDWVGTQQLGIKKFTDNQILQFAAKDNRVVFTHDERKFSTFAYELIGKGEKMSGVVIVPSSLAIGAAIDELDLVLRCRFDHEWQNRVIRVPI